MLPLGEKSRLRGEAPGEPRGERPGESGPPGLASGSSEAVAPKSTALPQEGQKRAVPGTALPQAGQLMVVAEYITARFQAQTLQSDHSRETRS